MNDLISLICIGSSILYCMKYLAWLASAFLYKISYIFIITFTSIYVDIIFIMYFLYNLKENRILVEKW